MLFKIHSLGRASQVSNIEVNKSNRLSIVKNSTENEQEL